nr:MAG TPA: hypothetical protein [Caudoviricetes sp.]
MYLDEKDDIFEVKRKEVKICEMLNRRRRIL